MLLYFAGNRKKLLLSKNFVNLSLTFSLRYCILSSANFTVSYCAFSLLFLNFRFASSEAKLRTRPLAATVFGSLCFVIRVRDVLPAHSVC